VQNRLPFYKGSTRRMLKGTFAEDAPELARRVDDVLSDLTVRELRCIVR
jgi:hypothetical protein